MLIYLVDIFAIAGSLAGSADERILTLYSSGPGQLLSLAFTNSSGIFGRFDFPINVADGLKHDILLSADNGLISIYVDNMLLGNRMIGVLKSCLNDCAMFIGQRPSPLGGDFFFTGLVERALFKPDQCLAITGCTAASFLN